MDDLQNGRASGRDDRKVDPLYGLYDGNQRLSCDQVPEDLRRSFGRTLAHKGAKMVFGWKANRDIEKRVATNFVFVRAEGKQPPPFLVLAGAPTKNADGSYNTKLPVNKGKQEEAKKYARMGVNVYWDKKFRTSHWVLVDAFRDLRTWLSSEGEDREVVIQLDNLSEHCSTKLQEELKRLQIRPIYLPPNSTDLGSVVDYDLGKKDKENIKKCFREDFIKRKTFYTRPSSSGGMTNADFRELLVTWLLVAHKKRDPDLIRDRFKKCAFYNALEGEWARVYKRCAGL